MTPDTATASEVELFLAFTPATVRSERNRRARELSRRAIHRAKKGAKR